MSSKSTTQKLTIHWQDRSWQPQIRRAPDSGRSGRGTGGSGRVRPANRGAAVRSLVLSRPAAPSRRACRGGLLRSVHRVVLALRPRRRN